MFSDKPLVRANQLAQKVGEQSKHEWPQYIEGTWAPTWQGTTEAGAFTYSVRVGQYTRIGNTVWLSAKLVITAIGTSPTGNLVIGGLPFTSRNTPNLVGTISWGNTDNFNLGTGTFAWVGRILPNANVIELYSLRDNTTGLVYPASDLNATTGVEFTGVYWV